VTTLSQILETKIVAIIRGANPADVLKIANALLSGGIKALEITINSPKALQVIESVVDEFGDRLLVGAGTVLDAQTARAAISAGAKYIISPTVDIETIRITKKYGIVSIPGAFTATEILTAYAHGGDIIKLFPATGGAAYLSNIRGPLAHIPLMPTGGVNLENIVEFQKAGAVAFGIGSALVDSSQEVNESWLNKLTERAAKFMAAIQKL
jgi:2-dehydro-3-deoxyphosphogluconate aldolase/(4S)-4-hydroxy-2-oxoglutarate aldolase